MVQPAVRRRLGSDAVQQIAETSNLSHGQISRRVGEQPSQGKEECQSPNVGPRPRLLTWKVHGCSCLRAIYA